MAFLVRQDGSGDYTTITAAVDAALASGVPQTIIVGPGIYTEDVVIKSPVELISEAGRGSTEIVGQQGQPGAITIQAGVNDVTIEGFTVRGNNGNGASESAAVYLAGNHDNIKVYDNEIEARGDAGLMSVFGYTVTNIDIEGNAFTGQTFLGTEPGGTGFSTQFVPGNNVPRQLVVMSPSDDSDVRFVNNVLSGTAGGFNSNGEQGNTLATLDVPNSVISGNTFSGFTNYTGYALRVRKPGTEISNNHFDASANDADYAAPIFTNQPGQNFNNSFTDTNGVTTFQGSSGNDLVTGTDGDDVFVATAGNDDIDGGANGDNGDTFSFGSTVESGSTGGYANLVTGVAFSGGSGLDTLSNIENLKGGAGNDVLIGDENDNTFFASGGNDQISGDVGSDTLDASSTTGPTFISLNAGTANLGGGNSATLSGIENVIGGSSGDYIEGSNESNILVGNGGNDYFFGAGGDDEIQGGAGSDDRAYFSVDSDDPGLSVTFNSTSQKWEVSFNGQVSTLTGVESIDFGDGETFLLVGGGSELTLQSALAGVGDTILLADGQHLATGSILVNRSVNIIGAGEGETTIVAAVTAYGILVDADNVTISNLTVDANNTTHYGIKVQPNSQVPTDSLVDFTLSSVTVKGAGRSEIDLNGVDGAVLENVTADGTDIATGLPTAGVGIGISDSTDITLTNITTQNNAWGSIGVFSKGATWEPNTSDVSFTGTFNSNELIQIYSDEENTSTVSGLDFSGLDGYAQVWKVENDSWRTEGAGRSDDFTWYFSSEADAVEFATSLTLQGNPANASVAGDSIVTGPFANTNVDSETGSTFVVAEGLSIQEALDHAQDGDTIYIRAGEYTENLVIRSGVNIVADAGAKLMPASGSAISFDLNDAGASVSITGLQIAGGDFGVHVGAGNLVGSLTLDGVDFDGIAENAVYVQADSVSSLTITDGDFTNSGFDSLYSTAHIKLEGFHGTALLEGLTFEGDDGSSDLSAWPNNAIEMIGTINSNLGSQPTTDIGSVTIRDVTVTGSFANTGVAIYNYADTDGLEIDGLDLTGVESGWNVPFNMDGITGDIDASGYDIDLPTGASLVLQGDKVAQGPHDNDFTGTVGADFFNGKAGSDTFTGNGGADTIYGGSGSDKAQFDASMEDAVVEFDGSAWTVTIDGVTTTLTGVEHLEFNDGASVFLVGGGSELSLQEAIQQSDASGDTILINGPITLTSQVVVDRDVTIRGVDATAALNAGFNTGYGTPAGGLIVIEAGVTASISDLAISGAGQNVQFGLLVLGTATVDNVDFSEIKYPGYDGRGIAVTLGGHADISDSTFTQIGRIGVHFRNDTTGTVTDSVFTGKGDGDWLDYSIEAGAGAQITLRGNTISGNTGVAASDGSGSAGILVTTYFGAGTQVTLIDNTITGNSAGVAGGYDYEDTSAVIFDTAEPNTIEDGVSLIGNGTYSNTASLSTPITWDAGDANNVMDGGSADDVLDGNAGQDTINGNDGEDLITGGADADTLSGGDGDDTFVIDNGDFVAGETIDGGVDDEDTIEFVSTVDGDTLTLTDGVTNIETVTLTGSADTNVNASAVDNGLAINGNAGDNVITGTVFGDTVEGNDGKDTVEYGSETVAVTYSDEDGWTATDSEGVVDSLSGIEIVQDGAAGKTLLVGNGGFATIQAAIDAAGEGDTILISEGSYEENLTVATDGLTFRGIGEVTIQGNFAELNSTPPYTFTEGSMVSEYLANNNYSTAAGTGITVSASGLSLDNINISGFTNGLLLDGAAGEIVGLDLNNVDISSSIFGLWKANGQAVSNLTITNGSFEDLYDGLYLANDAPVLPGAVKHATNVTVDGTLFKDITDKGIYAETLQGNTQFLNIEMQNVGVLGRGVNFDGNTANHGGFGTGIDVNLKFGDYDGTILIDGFDFDNVGTSNGKDATGHFGGAAIAVKGRNELGHGTYTPFPADVTGLTVTISNGTIDGTSTGIRQGEPGKTNPANLTNGPTVTVDNVAINGNLSNTKHGEIDNVSLTTMVVMAGPLNGSYVASATTLGAIQFLGDAANNSFTGGQGSDEFTGGLGVDALFGGAGNDTFIYNSAAELEAGEQVDGGTGTADTIRYAASTGTLVLTSNVTNIDAIVLSGTGGSVDASAVAAVAGLTITGNTGANTIVGTAGSDTIDAGDGNDVVNYASGNGADTVAGDLGVDTVNVSTASPLIVTGATVDITNTIDNELSVVLGGGASGSVVSTSVETLGVTLGSGGVNTVTLTGDLAASGVTKVVVTGGNTRTALRAESLTSATRIEAVFGSGDDTFYGGGAGNDSLTGGLGFDTLNYTSATQGVVVNLATNSAKGLSIGDDFVTGFEAVRGTQFYDVIRGNTQANTFYATAGADYIDGRGINDGDTYDARLLTDAMEIDLTVGFAFGAATGLTNLLSIENVVGTRGNDTIYGTSGANVIDGYVGGDYMEGGDGNDTYYVNSADDQVVENANEGYDTVHSETNYTLGANVEKLVLEGTANRTGTGNSLDNVLVGNSGNNVLNGRGGADTMSGGLGNDTYHVNTFADNVIEASGANTGIDTVISETNYRLSANVENLTIIGTANRWAEGNELNNEVRGNTGANAINGKAGADKLFGGGGVDTFEFDSSEHIGNSYGNCDVIGDWATDDFIDLTAFGSMSFISNSAFSGAGQAEVRFEPFDYTGTSNDYTRVLGDTNGDGVVDFVIQITGLHTMAQDDFILVA